MIHQPQSEADHDEGFSALFDTFGPLSEIPKLCGPEKMGGGGLGASGDVGVGSLETFGTLAQGGTRPEIALR